MASKTEKLYVLMEKIGTQYHSITQELTATQAWNAFLQTPRGSGKIFVVKIIDSK